MFKGKSSESTAPLTNESHFGIWSSQSSIMKTLLTYNLILFFFFLVSNISNGALLGMKSIALNSSYPSTEKCLTDKCSSQSLVRALQKATYSSLVTSSPFLIHNGLVLFYSSNSWVTSLTFFFFLSFGLSISSSTSNPSSSFLGSPSFFSAGSSSSSSEISFSVVFSTYNRIGKEMNSECFLINSFNLFSSTNSTLSDLRRRVI